MIIAPPHFMIDLQQRWPINREIGNRQCTYYLIVCALTIADFFFFCSRRLLGAIIHINRTYFRRNPHWRANLSHLTMRNGMSKGGNASEHFVSTCAMHWCVIDAPSCAL
jgi:hypothetical protein